MANGNENERVERILIKFAVMQTDAAAARRGVQNIKKELDQFQAKQKSATQIQRTFNAELGKLAREKAVGQISRNFVTLEKELGDSSKALKIINQQLKDIGASDKEIQRVARELVKLQEAQASLDGGRRKKKGPSALTSFGRELKALPAVGIPGLGFSTDVVGKVLQLFGKLSPSALAAGAAVGGLTVAIAILADNANKAREAALADLDARQRALELLKAGNKEEVEERIKALRTQRDNNRQAVDDANAVFAQLREGIFENFGSLGLAISDFNSTIGTGAGELSAAKNDIDAANKTYAETNTELLILEQGVASLGNSAEATAEAINRAIQYIVDQRRFELEASRLSTDQIKQRQQTIQDEIALLELEIAARKAQGENTDELIERWAALGQQEAYLTDVAYDLAAARETEAEAIAFEEQQLEDIIAAHRKYSADVASIEEKSLEQRAALAEKYNDALVKAAETATNAAENALEKLQEKRDAIAADFTQDETDERKEAQLKQLDDLIEFQNDEARALREHQRNLEQIRRDAQRAEADLIANRDFAGLFRLRRDTGFQLEDANRVFSAERQEQAQAFKERLQDQIVQYARERDQRTAKYAQDLAEAQAQYQKELEQADLNRRKALDRALKAHNDDLRTLDTKLRTELNAKRQAYDADLKLIAQASDLRQQAYQREVENARRILANALAQGSGGSATHPGRQYGGAVRRGQTVNVNERRPESFTSAGRTSDFPRSQGLFTPNQAGRVNSRAGANVNMDVDFNLAGNMNNPEAIWRALEPRFTRLLERYFGAA